MRRILENLRVDLIAAALMVAMVATRELEKGIAAIRQWAEFPVALLIAQREATR